MKMKIKAKGFDNKEKEFEVSLSGKDHLEAQKRYHSVIFRDKTKYTRKVKHKAYFDDKEI